MKTRWIWTALGLVPFLAAMISLQSCGGEGGPVGGDGGGGLPSISEQFLALLSDEQKTASYVGSERCADGACHGGRAHSGRDGDPPQYTQWMETKHFDRGVGCERCHGPGSKHADNPTEENILTFPKSTSPVVCGQCHGNIFDEHQKSAHNGFLDHGLSNSRSSRCITCHSGLARTQIYEQGLDLANTTQVPDAMLTEIIENTEAVVPHTATCVTCHDPHAARPENPNKDGKDVQLRHKVFQGATTDQNGNTINPGSSAASFTKFDQICAQCHNGRGANGADSAIANSTARPNMHDSPQFNMLMGVGGAEDAAGPIERNMAHASAEGQCTKCHMPSGRHSFTVSFDTGCAPCHTPSDAANRMNALTNEINQKLYALRTKLQEWALATFPSSRTGYDSTLNPVRESLWDYSTVIDEEWVELGGTGTAPVPANHQSANIPIQIKRARHNYYFLLRDSSVCPHNPPYSRYLLQVANDNVDELMAAGRGVGSPSRVASTPSMNVIKQLLAADRDRARRADMQTHGQD